MHRFYCAGSSITGSDHIHIKTVLRLKSGDQISLFDGESEFLARIVSVGASATEVEILERLPGSTEPQCRITLYQAAPKADKLELIVQKCTEVGFCALVPFQSERCVGKPGSHKFDRLGKIAYEATKQSGRIAIPRIEPMLSFNEMLSRIGRHELSLCAWEGERQATLHTFLRPGLRDVALIVGSEGGFADGEASAIRAAGAATVTLGKRILRTETAGIALCAIVLHETELTI